MEKEINDFMRLMLRIFFVFQKTPSRIYPDRISWNTKNSISLKKKLRMKKRKVSLKDVFSQENILRALRESTEIQNEILSWKTKKLSEKRWTS